MTRDEWLKLAERCEQHDVKDPVKLWGLSIAILDACGMSWKGLGPANVAKSLDAITALIEQELPEWQPSSARRIGGDGSRWAGSWLVHVSKDVTDEGKGATEALARCAAFCRAMAEKEPT